MASGTAHSGSGGEKHGPFLIDCLRVGPICLSTKRAVYPCGGLNVWCPVVAGVGEV